MEEKKKRIRPTWKQVHELENIIKEREKLIDEMKELIERQTSTLEKSTALIKKTRDENLSLRLENERLLSRSFIERLFNK